MAMESPGEAGSPIEVAVARAIDHLLGIYTLEEAWLWLRSPHAMLDNDRAIDLLHAGRGNEVLAVIDRLVEGAYT
jgi:uncharacterized protein (DUF2384 family)